MKPSVAAKPQTGIGSGKDQVKHGAPRKEAPSSAPPSAAAGNVVARVIQTVELAPIAQGSWPKLVSRR